MQQTLRKTPGCYHAALQELVAAVDVEGDVVDVGEDGSLEALALADELVDAASSAEAAPKFSTRAQKDHVQEGAVPGSSKHASQFIATHPVKLPMSVVPAQTPAFISQVNEPFIRSFFGRFNERGLSRRTRSLELFSGSSACSRSM